MAGINLLPWRDHYREEKKKEFMMVIVGVAVLAGFISYLWFASVKSGISSQNGRNQMLRSEIAILEDKVSEIRELRERREELLARMKVIQDLQGTRPIIVRYFDELVRAIPGGVYLQTLNRKEKEITIEGTAQSNNRVSSLMRNLDESAWFTSPNLTSVKTDPKSGEQANIFKMSVSTSAPKDQKKED